MIWSGRSPSLVSSSRQNSMGSSPFGHQNDQGNEDGGQDHESKRAA